MPHPTLEDAIAFAAKAHEKSPPDKAGERYILHPLRVMLDPSCTPTDEERITAVLHDVMEDCGVTPEQLRGLGYSDAVVVALGFRTYCFEG